MTSIGACTFYSCNKLKYIIVEGDDPDRLSEMLKARNDLPAGVVVMNSNYEVLHPDGMAFEKPGGFDVMHKAQKRAHIHAYFAPDSIDSMPSVMQPYMRSPYPNHVVMFNQFPKLLKNIINITAQAKEMVKMVMLSATACKVRSSDADADPLVKFLGAVAPEIWLIIID